MSDVAGHRDNPGSWTVAQMVEAATVHAEAGEWDAALALSNIAQARVFLQDAEAVADQVRAEVEESLGQVSRGGMVAIERMAEATRILQQATRSGPRHPAIHAALAVLTGESSIGVSEPRQVGEPDPER